MDRILQAAKNSRLFSDFAEEEIKRDILPYGRLQNVPKGAYLIRFQEQFQEFAIVMKGKLNIQHIYADGNYGIMGILGAGDILGLDLVCTRSRISPYYAVAAQPTQVLLFPGGLIMNAEMLKDEQRQKLMQRALLYIADENMRKEYRLAILFQKGIRDRIMTYLTMQANKRHTATFTVPFTREEMASYLCVNRSCLSHELSLMEQEGLIRFSKNMFTLLHWEQTGNGY